MPFFSGTTLGPYQVTAKIAVPDTHTRFLRSSYGRQAQYQLSIALPHGYKDEERSYPVLYILDANAQFGTVTETVRAVALIEQSIPQLIVIGIGYPVGVYWNAIAHRSIDLTPTSDETWEAESASVYSRFPQPLGTGGAITSFASFVTS